MIGKVVLILEKSEDGQCKGVIGEREGCFPGNCTRERTYDCCTVLSHSELSVSSLMPKGTLSLVETPHHGDDDEFDLEKSNVATVLVKRDSHWWIGQLKGKRGLFPANNAKEIKGTVVHVIVAIKS